MSGKTIVLDANILIRAVLGQRVRQLILAHASEVNFFAPDVAYADARKLQRIATRDADDWPVLACAMAWNCPVWTEDTDFFGSGVATWTTDRIALYLA
jgi:predicted nucleic acid-binding protein